jgi:glycine betaine/proline transport system substrate-binding protein
VTVNYGAATLEGKHDAALDLIRNSTMPNSVQAGLIYDVDINGRDVEEVVDEWLDANEATWKAWVQ